MNQVLEFNRIKAQQADTKAIEEFVSAAIQMNIESLISLISVLKGDQKEYAIDTFVYRIIALLMADKDKSVIVEEWINSGTIFLLKDKLVAGFRETLKI